MKVNKYKAYKDSGVEWLGQIPEGWTLHRFRNIFSFSKGLNITKENLQDSGIPCVNYGEVHSKYGFEVDPYKHKLKCVEESYLESSSKSILKSGDFIFADTSEDIEGSGNFTYLNSEEKVFAGYHTVIAKPKNQFRERYLAYLFDSITYRSQVRRMVKGVKVYSITNGILKSTLLWLPQKEDRTKIANFLDNKTTKIDTAIAQKEKMIALLKERKQIMIQNAVTKGLDPNAKMKDSGVEWIGEIPEGWEVKRLKYLFTEFDNRSTTGKETLLSLRMELGLVPHDDVSNTEITDKQLIGYKIVQNGHMVMNRMRAAIGLFGVVKQSSGLVSPDYATFNVRPTVNNDYYLRMFKLELLCTVFRLNSKGLGTGSSGFMRLYSESFGRIKVATPPFQEQEAIVLYIEIQSAKIDKAIALQEKQIEKLKEYKAVLIDSAVTGKIKVSEL